MAYPAHRIPDPERGSPSLQLLDGRSDQRAPVLERIADSFCALPVRWVASAYAAGTVLALTILLLSLSALVG